MVTAPIADPYGNDRVGLNLTTKLDRTDFGVDWNNPLPNGEPSLANDVAILAELQSCSREATRASGADPGHLRQPSSRLAQQQPVARRGRGRRPGRPVRALRPPQGGSAV